MLSYADFPEVAQSWTLYTAVHRQTAGCGGTLVSVAGFD
jgi:hypothetical protein